MFLEEKLDYLISEQKRLSQMVELFLPNLETEKGVIHFMEITKNTLNTYLAEGVFKEGVHYTRKDEKRLFIPMEIVKLKKAGIKWRRKTSENDQQIVHALKGKLGIITSCVDVPNKGVRYEC